MLIFLLLLIHVCILVYQSMHIFLVYQKDWYGILLLRIWAKKYNYGSLLIFLVLSIHANVSVATIHVNIPIFSSHFSISSLLVRWYLKFFLLFLFYHFILSVLFLLCTDQAGMLFPGDQGQPRMLIPPEQMHRFPRPPFGMGNRMPGRIYLWICFYLTLTTVISQS